MNIRPTTNQDYELINRLCNLSYQNQSQWIGYPRVESIDELFAEIEEYNNTLDNCVKIIERQSEPIGFTGYLHEEGDDESYIIGPVFTNAHHTKQHVMDVLALLKEQSHFSKLMLTTPSNNEVTHSAIRQLKWKRTHQQLEMVYDLKHPQHFRTYPDISIVDNALIPEVAHLFESAFNWEQAEKRLCHYLFEFGMKAACIKDNEQLKGAILWDEVEGTNFVRLEDIAVHPKARRQGIASSLIEYSLIKASEQSKDEVFLAVDLDNQKAINLYEKIGFNRNMVNYSYITKS